MNILLILAIFWPALAGLVIFLTPGCKENKQLRGRAVNAALAVELALTLAMCMGQGTKMVLLNMTPTLRIEMNVDMTGCIFAVLMSTMWLLSSVFAREYMGHDGHERLYQVFFMCVLSALIGQCYAGSMVTLYVFYELMTLLSVPMVVHERTPQAVAAGIKYLVYSIFGAMLGLLGIFFFSNYLGTVTFVPGGVETAASAPSGLLLITFLVIIGFGTKAGMFPMHGWLPTAHPIAPAPASAVLSGVITKTGVLCIIRVLYYVVGPDFVRGTWVQTVLLILALITVFMGSMMAFKVTGLKKRLAYSTVSQVSYMLFGLFLLNELAFTGAILHVFFHSVMKNALFLCAGAVILKTGKTDVRDLRGIGKQMPVTLWCFTLAGVGLVGVPPMSGFLSKWQLAQGALASTVPVFNWLGPVVLLVSALLTAAYLLPVSIDGFFPGRPEGAEAGAYPSCEVGAKMLIPLIVLAALTVLLGLWPSLLQTAIETVAAGVLLVCCCCQAASSFCSIPVMRDS